MKKGLAILPLLLGILVYPCSTSSQASLHQKVVLRGIDGTPLSIESTLPYSPKKTCGACHEYHRITQGYHFQQGRTDGRSNLAVSDTFDPKHPWNLSPGLFGKHTPASFDSSQLAKKVNLHPSEIDKSTYYIVQNCGPCHPGGGFGEYDRKGNLYYSEDTGKFGFELSGDDPLLDGDYTSYSMGDPRFGAPWDRSGVSEADCLICHLKGYRWQERAVALKARRFKYGPTVGAGWASVKLSPGETGSLKAEEVVVDYTKNEIADFENLHLQIVRRPPDENCWSCHAVSSGKRKGRQWSPETDIHKARGFDCVSCHPADKEHNLAKGNTLQQTVRNDLDHTMHSCEDCHYRGKHRKAPRYRHPFSPRHMKMIACQTCHIPYQSSPADLVHDHASGGETIVYDTLKFQAGDPHDPRRAAPGVELPLWFPTIREVKGKIVPVKSLITIYWGDLDEKSQGVKPLPLWKIREMKKPPIKDDNGDGIPEVNSFEEIKAFLKTLKGKDSLGHPIAQNPVLIKGGFLYQLDKKGEVEKIKHEQAEPHDFSLSHNVVSGPMVIGARGCKDCHSRNSPFFLRKVLIDPYDEKGKPIFIETWQRLGIGHEKLTRLLLEQ